MRYAILKIQDVEGHQFWGKGKPIIILRMHNDILNHRGTWYLYAERHSTPDMMHITVSNEFNMADSTWRRPPC